MNHNVSLNFYFFTLHVLMYMHARYLQSKLIGKYDLVKANSKTNGNFKKSDTFSTLWKLKLLYYWKKNYETSFKMLFY